jgi:sugar lactone lactonase YvrE
MKTNIYTILVSAMVLLFSFGAKAQVIVRYAGDTTAGFFGDGGPATAAKIKQAAVLARDAAGNNYIGEYNGNKIRKVTSAGIISTIAGTSGIAGWMGDGGPATAAELNNPVGLAFDAAGNLFIADFANQVIRKIDGSGVITTVAGTATVQGYSGDGGPATAAKFRYPRDIKFDAAGNMYICDMTNYAIRMINTAGTISTIAGTGVIGYTGDGGPATAATLSLPYRTAFDASGNLFFVEGGNNSVRKIDMITHKISTVVGDGSGLAGFTGDGFAATTARLKLPTALAFDVAGNMYIADGGNGRIRMVNTAGVISTVVGTGPLFETGNGGPATACTINQPLDLQFDRNGNLYIADDAGNAVREVVAFPKAAYTAPGALCLDSCAKLISNGRGSLDSLRWVVSGGKVTGPTSDTMTACFSTAGSYNVSLYVHNISGSDTMTTTMLVKNPPHPVVSVHAVLYTGIVSVPGLYTGYQWYSNIFFYPPYNLISGAISSFDTCRGYGDYYVVVDSAGCPGNSDTGIWYQELVPTINQPASNFWLSQPGNNAIALHAVQSLNNELDVTIYDAAGRQLISDKWAVGSNTKQISCISISPGLYIIKLCNSSSSTVLKWMKH